MKNEQTSLKETVAGARTKPYIILKRECCKYFETGICPMALEHREDLLRFPKPGSRQDIIIISKEARGWEISRYGISERLKHLLEWQNVRVFGDLHGLRYSRMNRWRGWGIHTIAELLAMVARVQEDAENDQIEYRI
jgi:hypothetical protein